MIHRAMHAAGAAHVRHAVHAGAAALPHLPAGSSTIGRGAECDIVLNDSQVSRYHCRVLVDSGVQLVDAGSSNGIIVGGERWPRITLANGETAHVCLDRQGMTCAVPASLKTALAAHA